jgi:hypothetical protein
MPPRRSKPYGSTTARKKRHNVWLEPPDGKLPQDLVAAGILPHVMRHIQDHPWCWACRAPGDHTVTVQSRRLNLAGGNITMYTLCQRCTQDPQVRERLIADLDQDEDQAEQIRTN